MSNTGYLLMPIFESNKTHIGSIINYGNVSNGNITYETKEGIVTKNIAEIEDPIIIRYENDFDLKKSLYHWIKRDRYVNQGKEFILDNSINTGEIYTESMWHISVMLQVTDTQVKCKLIYQ